MATRTTVTIDDETYELGDDFLSDVLETAVEGACSYWADVSAETGEDGADSGRARDFGVSDYVEDDNDDQDGDMVDADEAVMFTEASFVVTKDPTLGGTLDLQGIADAIERIASGEVEVAPAIREIIMDAVRNDDASDIDAEAADCIVQVGLFDEVVYD